MSAVQLHQPARVSTDRHRGLFGRLLCPWMAVVVLLGIHAGLLAWSAYRHSPNVNEPSHLAAGISHWESGRFELYRVNPPLVRMVAALPVLVVGAETDWSSFSASPRSRSEFRVGPDFIAVNGERSLWLTTLARWMCIPFSLIGGLICFLWGRDLYGPAPGLLGLTLWCFSPNILGHASCLTPDAHATALGLAANYLFWLWLRQPTWGRAGAAGIVLGLALLTKTTWILLLVLWPVVWTAWRLVGRSQYRPRTEFHPSIPRGLQLALMILLGLHVLNLGYLYDGTFRRLGDFRFISRTLGGQPDGKEGNRFQETLLAALPVPLPAQYVIGADVQKRDFERHPVSYFRGRTYRHGFWYYYLYALGVKVPLGTWLLVAAALVFELSRRARLCPRRDEVVLLTPLVFLLAIVSAETDYSAHFRYALPIVPYAFIWIGQVGAGVNGAALRLVGARRLRHLSWAAVVLTGLCWSAASSLAVAPHWLSYFNEAAGGPLRGHEHLANSNLDWGQDLLYLREWLAESPSSPLRKGTDEPPPIGLAYYGMFHPHAIGIEFQDVPGWITEPDELEDARRAAADALNVGPRPGWYAVSVNFVVGHPFWNYRSDGSRGWFGRAYFTYFRRLQPVARAGYSIYIYHVTESDVRRLQAEFPMSRRPSAGSGDGGRE